jgi:hypothetical protein
VRPYLEKNPSQKKGLVEWLKAKALSSSPSTTKKRIWELDIVIKIQSKISTNKLGVVMHAVILATWEV